LPSAPHLDMI